MNLKDALQTHSKTMAACYRHKAACKDCYMPIIDDEGNPGLKSEACAIGAQLLKEYETAEQQVFSIEKTSCSVAELLLHAQSQDDFAGHVFRFLIDETSEQEIRQIVDSFDGSNEPQALEAIEEILKKVFGE